MNNISNLRINNEFIRRNSDFSFFDPSSFQLLKMNADAFELLDLIDQGSISEIDIEDPDINAFLKTCLENKVLLNQKPNEERSAHEKES